MSVIGWTNRMTTPTSIIVECPMCKDETLHQVLSGKMAGKNAKVLDSTVKCRACGHVHHVVLKSEKPVTIPVIVSWLKESKRDSVVLGPEEVLSIDDEMMCGDLPVLVTSIESKAGARVDSCKAGDISAIWAKRFDKVKISFSINHHGKTYAEQMIASPDEEFSIGDMLQVGKRDVVIHAIKIQGRSVRKGSVAARDVVRIYANIVRKTTY